MDAINDLKDELGQIAGKSPEAQRIIALRCINNITNLASGPSGIGQLLQDGRISIIPGPNGTAEDAERAVDFIDTLTQLCNACRVMIGDKRINIR